LISKKWTIPLLEPLIPDGLSSGTLVLVEFDPEGQWFAVSRSLAALSLKKGLRAVYFATARPREEVIASLAKLGVDVNEVEKAGLLRIDDAHTSTLSVDKDNPGFVAVEDSYLRVGSPKIADLSIVVGRDLRGSAADLSKWGSDQSDVVSIVDSWSPLLRFNEERTFLEFLETRSLPLQRKLGRIEIDGMANRVHSEPFYARLEGTYDGLIEVRALERNEEIKNMLRIRNLKGQPHDARWHEIKIDSRGEASLVT
jgi:KaiC/GvpD/RAD55 family RecA-like ATPase